MKAKNNRPKQVDISNCAEEPIHMPGSIQPHGVLIGLSLPDFKILHASKNTEELFGKPAEEILNTTFNHYIESKVFDNIKEILLSPNVSDFNPIKIKFTQGNSSILCDGIAHILKNILILELEKASQSENANFTTIYQKINSTISRIENSTDLLSLCQSTSSYIKNLTSFDRVTIYQFDNNWNGKVIAESKEPEQEPFLGLQYPASDVPAQARKLYEQSWMRIIPAVTYQAAEIISVESEEQYLPLDLSRSVLRSVSPMHIQYLKNMEVGASMSISIIRSGRLWGLIACHHKTPNYLPFEIRKGLEHIGKFFSLQLAVTEKHENVEYKVSLKNLQIKLYDAMKSSKNFIDGLKLARPNLLDLVFAQGGAIYFRNQLTLLGQTPKNFEVLELLSWMHTKIGQNALYVTDSLIEDYPKGKEIKDTASGLLCISIPEPEPSYIVWFRPEVIQTVNWAGNPEKAVEVTEAGTKLGPRRSFALWKQKVQFKSEPWKLEEIDIAQDLRRSVIEIDLERQVLLEKKARSQAERSNKDLDDFAYIVSHDLKEPLRSIKIFADFVRNDEKEKISPESIEHLKEIIGLTDRSKTLISVLHEFSRLGHVELAVAKIDLSQILNSVIARLAPLIKETNTEIIIPKPLPTIECDQARVSEIFSNLITNAIRHNQKEKKKIEIGFDSFKVPPHFYVRDNGPGIPTESQATLFQIFQRNTSTGAPNSGTGSGLAIVKRIIDRHEGKIWVETAPEAGTTFYFTLAPEAIGESIGMSRDRPLVSQVQSGA